MENLKQFQLSEWQQRLSNIGNKIMNEVVPPIEKDKPINYNEVNPQNEDFSAVDLSSSSENVISNVISFDEFDAQLQLPHSKAILKDSQSNKDELFSISKLESKNAELSADLRDVKGSLEDLKASTSRFLLHLLALIENRTSETTEIPSEFNNEASAIIQRILELREDNPVSKKELENKEKIEKLTKESSRLREHLIETEELHTKEILELQAKIDELEGMNQSDVGKIRAYDQILNESSDLNDQLSTQMEQMKRINLDLESDLRTKSEECENLKGILRNYEISKQGELDLVTSSLKIQNFKLQEQCDLLKAEVSNFKAFFESLNLNREEITQLSKDYREKCDQVTSLEKQVANLSLALTSSSFYTSTVSPKRAMETRASPVEAIDPKLIADLIIKYFSSDSDKRIEILVLITKILCMNDEERKQIGLVYEKGHWIRRKSIETEQKIHVNDSIVEQWISFLLTEAKNSHPEEEELNT